MTTDTKRYERSDFQTDQEVRWCPGCGDYAILKAVQRTLADIGASVAAHLGLAPGPHGRSFLPLAARGP